MKIFCISFLASMIHVSGFALDKTTFYTETVTGEPHYDIIQNVRMNHQQGRANNRVFCHIWLKERVDTENGFRIRVDWIAPPRRPCNNLSQYPDQGPGRVSSSIKWAKMITHPDGKKDELKCRGIWRVRVVLEEPEGETVLWRKKFRIGRR